MESVRYLPMPSGSNEPTYQSSLAGFGIMTLDFACLARSPWKFESGRTDGVSPRSGMYIIWNSIFLGHFDHFYSDIANSHSEKVVFWGRGRVVSHIFPTKKVFKNEKCFCFLKVWKLSFPTVPVRASNSQWSPRTVKNKNKLWISKSSPFEFRHLSCSSWVTSLGWEFEGWRFWNSHFIFVFDRSRRLLGVRSSHRYC